MKKYQIIQWLRYAILYRSIALLPNCLAYRAVTYIARFQSRFNSAHKQAYQRGLQQQPSPPSAQEVKLFWRKHCELMAREILDIYLLPRIARQNNDKVYALTNLDALKKAQAVGKGVIVAMGHYGRPVALSTAVGCAGEKIGMLTQIIDERNPHLDPVDRRYLAFKMNRIVKYAQGRWLTTGDSPKALYAALQAGETLIILFDLHQPDLKSTVHAPFLGGEIRAAQGIERIAKKTGARIIYGSVREHGQKCVVELRPLPSDPHAALVAAVAELEQDVIQAPWQWWQWNIFEHLWFQAPKP